ncbi:uncharacterized protein C8R40DRAFT_1074219 [Lentinula edodes]|uniref:uncharacterized protein n=1 Tax=Lentinula edodes TaxID=5353 RepID=UPI001E8CE730|nr:uncharacterized protein C8R40DRAFT_1074729 [Lentinula edodes]XP_046080365.1 uncharacterized protein C8R40DRAFT_1074219 [Lentinula edodes]KAH7868587.1 hypothetical protein C8R40DRAFT_1074729 [Lentinula edodes]KAH7869271.1 hypothetical protein C8R40DRAFT_1074219 [Lentinula edodes]
MFLRRSSAFCQIFYLYIVFAALLGVSLVTSSPLVAVPHLLERSGGDQPKITRPRQEMKQHFLSAAALIRSFTETSKNGDLVIRLGCREPGQEEKYMVANVRIMSLLKKDLKFTIFFGTIVGFSASNVIVEQSDIPRSDVSETAQSHHTPRIDQGRLIKLGPGRDSSLVAHFDRNNAAKKQLVNTFGDADKLLSHTQAMFLEEYGFSWAHILVINDDLDYITVALICMQMMKGPEGQVLAQGVLGEWLKIYLAMKALRGSDSSQYVMAVEWLLEGKYHHVAESEQTPTQ